MANADTIYYHPLTVQQKPEEKFQGKANGNGLVMTGSIFIYLFYTNLYSCLYRKLETILKAEF